MIARRKYRKCYIFFEGVTALKICGFLAYRFRMVFIAWISVMGILESSVIRPLRVSSLHTIAGSGAFNPFAIRSSVSIWGFVSPRIMRPMVNSRDSGDPGEFGGRQLAHESLYVVSYIFIVPHNTP